jgi:hypothetical protein
MSRHNGDLVALAPAADRDDERQQKNFRNGRPPKFFCCVPEGRVFRATSSAAAWATRLDRHGARFAEQGREAPVIFGNAAYRASTHRRQPDKLMFRKAERRAERAACNL